MILLATKGSSGLVATLQERESVDKIHFGSFREAVKNVLGAVHILRNTLWGGGGLPDLLQYYIGGISPIYYNIT